jgi:hypothetical protein
MARYLLSVHGPATYGVQAVLTGDKRWEHVDSRVRLVHPTA